MHMHTCIHAHTYMYSSHIWQSRHILSRKKSLSAPWWFSPVTADVMPVSLSLRAKRSHSPKCWCTTTVWQLTLQLPWRRAWAAAQALKASCIISWCVDTLAFSSIHCDSDAFSAQSSPPRRGDDSVQCCEVNTRGFHRSQVRVSAEPPLPGRSNCKV